MEGRIAEANVAVKVAEDLMLVAFDDEGAGQAGPDMGGASQGGNEAGYGDDVVDADYKEV